MALDGAFLRHLKKEITDRALGARVDKIYQPNKEELVFLLRTRQEAFKLLLSARANSPRIHFTQYAPENPKVPPMLCMLLRKRLSGAKLVEIRQPGLERLLYLDFDAANELGDKVRLSLVIEIMGKYSNIILVDGQGKIVDALKRVDEEMSSQRLVQPGLTYELPPAQNKPCMLECQPEEIVEAIVHQPKNQSLNKGILNALQGLSPVVCREVEHQVGRGQELFTRDLTQEQKERLRFFLERLFTTVRDTAGEPYMVTKIKGKPMEFSFLNIVQYGTLASVSRWEDFSSLLDEFYEERDRQDRMRVKAQDLLRLLANASERLSRKINLQRGELARSEDREHLRVCGDLINANLYRIERGSAFADLENFYDENHLMRIKLDPALNATQNAQKYYKEYRKAKTAQQVLGEQIAQAEQELLYVDSVFDCLSRAQSESELNEIRQELREEGYLKAVRDKRKPPAPLAPLEFVSSEGFRILVGRNNRQNDKLTLKQANNNDIWLHTKNIPGSHTIIVTGGRQPGDATLKEAAMLAAYHSRAKDSSQVPVDYTQIRYVSKPQGAKPGMVIYVHYQTLFVTPQHELTEKLKKL
ncbi:fibronectin/fibrinogen-binding protein [[Clostridium] leptum]|uniref:Rqc2 homolog RqcH n=1 Tax=[Clostridium] leptum TaxID=1535 RepID=A0A412AX62_9FIRM|nr:fibronectin/fibrinogen-binding protein [[Clostridium] leptum]